MSALERLQAVRRELEERGVKDVKFCFSPNVSGTPTDEVADHVVKFLRACLDDPAQPLPAIGDSVGLKAI